MVSLLYRGPLSSCNYACGYCPFAKRRESAGELAVDRDALERFVTFIREHEDERFSVLFTPWGEALIRCWYQEALIRLGHLPHVERVAIQTNLSCRLDWLDRCDLDSVALWVTYHPSQVPEDRFVRRIKALHGRGVRMSVGIVGLPQNLEAARRLRGALPEDIYLWVNAAKRVHGTYGDDLAAAFTSIDPLFPLNAVHQPSRGRACRTGSDVLSVDGEGTVRRCHFVPEVLGNLYDGSFRDNLRSRPCPNTTCGCHIGYVHMNRLGLYDVFRGGILERIPARRAYRRLAVVSGAS